MARDKSKSKSKSKSKKVEDATLGSGAGAGAGSAPLTAAEKKNHGVLEKVDEIMDTEFQSTDPSADNYVSHDDRETIRRNVKASGWASIYTVWVFFVAGRVFFKCATAHERNDPDEKIKCNKKGEVLTHVVIGFAKERFPWWDRMLSEFEHSVTSTSRGGKEMTTTTRGAPGMSKFEALPEFADSVDLQNRDLWETAVKYDPTFVSHENVLRAPIDTRNLLAGPGDDSKFAVTDLSKAKFKITTFPTVFNVDTLQLKTTVSATINRWFHHWFCGSFLADQLRDENIRALFHGTREAVATAVRDASDSFADSKKAGDGEFDINDWDETITNASRTVVHADLGKKGWWCPTKPVSSPGDRKLYEGNAAAFEKIAEAHAAVDGCRLTDGSDNNPAPGLLTHQDFRLCFTMPATRTVELKEIPQGDPAAIKRAILKGSVVERARKNVERPTGARYTVASDAMADDYHQVFYKDLVARLERYADLSASGNVKREFCIGSVPSEYTIKMGDVHVEGSLPRFGIGCQIQTTFKCRFHSMGMSARCFEVALNARKVKGFENLLGRGDDGAHVSLETRGIGVDAFLGDGYNSEDEDLGPKVKRVRTGGGGDDDVFHSTSGPARSKTPGLMFDPTALMGDDGDKDDDDDDDKK